MMVTVSARMREAQNLESRFRRQADTLAWRTSGLLTAARRRFVRRAPNIALVLLSVFVTLLACELALRGYFIVRTKRELAKMGQPTASEAINTRAGDLGSGSRLSNLPNVIYEIRPNLRGVYDGRRFQSNRYGFRTDREFSLEKPAGVTRIVGIGDSWMWGTGVNNGETYLDRLQEHLTELGLRTEVINTGVWGYDARQQVATLRWKGLLFHPDVVVVGLCGNDRGYTAFLSARPFVEFGGSFLWNEVKSRLSPLLSPGAQKVPADTELMPFSDFMAAYEELADLAHSNHFSVVVFSECFGPGDPPKQHPSCRLGTAEEWDRFTAQLDRFGFHRCGWDIDEIPQNFPQYGHATREGNRILAAVLEKCVRPLLGKPVARRP